MKQILVQLDDRTAQQLEAVAPGRSRKRSEFIRQAIAKALLELAECGTRAAYARIPDEPGLQRGGVDRCLRSAPPAQAAAAFVKQYELWWAELPKPVGARPVLLLSRNG